ncbi:MerR family transcriptional regulator [Cohnella sp. GbtcB17]|uniref:MerR family transcriptional regulator n=1 Tax=Cohnella sp. GbtcB17 TaxID=2824762 RepID=UPI001C3078CE|nr:MerR family transcriptional regulator [Cohnella sp. GbtcB17]
MNRMRIGDLTERAGVTQRTVRYYESIGLLPSGEREGNGHHYYTEETVARLQKIDQLKKVGLSLEEIRDVIELYFTDTSEVLPKRKVLGILYRHLADTDQKLEALGQFRSDLQSNIERFERWLEANERD